jgi:hypothetical protein
MKRPIMILFAFVLSTCTIFAGTSKSTKKQSSDHRTQRARQALIEDLRLRGSAIPVALSLNGKPGR